MEIKYINENRLRTVTFISWTSILLGVFFTLKWLYGDVEMKPAILLILPLTMFASFLTPYFSFYKKLLSVDQDHLEFGDFKISIGEIEKVKRSYYLGHIEVLISYDSGLSRTILMTYPDGKKFYNYLLQLNSND